MKPHVILTRPAQQSQRFGAEINQVLGGRVEVLISPLLRISNLDFEPVASGLDVIFTSENGVAGFVAGQKPGPGRAFCVGDRTAEAARNAGFEALSAGGASEDLIELIAREGAGEVVYARGQHVARDLPSALGALGIPVTEVLVYTQDRRDLSPQARYVVEGAKRVIFPLFSRRSMELLVEQGLAGGTNHKSAVCISSSVAEAAPAGVFNEIEICETPNSHSMLEKLQTLSA